jgi:hypothetical protein
MRDYLKASEKVGVLKGARLYSLWKTYWMAGMRGASFR